MLSLFSDFIIIFDFDKTIAENDVVVDLLDLYGDPGWREQERRVEEGKITLRECIEWELESFKITKSRFEKIMGRMIKLDKGARTLFRWISEKKYPVHIISDSLSEAIYYVMENENLGSGISYNVDAHELIWNTDGTLKGVGYANDPCKHHCGNCKISKVEQIKMFNPKSLIVYIGDGFTDILPAPLADIIFARKGEYLSNFLTTKDIRHYQYSNLEDVLNQLIQIAS